MCVNVFGNQLHGSYLFITDMDSYRNWQKSVFLVVFVWLHPISYCYISVRSVIQSRTQNNRLSSQLSSSSICFSYYPSLGYQISYRLDGRDPLRWTTVEVGSNARQFTVTGLSPEQAYVFRLIARTAVGWGEEQEALVVTTERRGKRTDILSFLWFLCYHHFVPICAALKYSY